MKTIKLEPQDNVIVALSNLSQGSAIETNAGPLTLLEEIPAKHKVFEQDMAADQDIIMYGVRVGKTTQAVKAGARMSTENSKHATDPYQYRGLQASWQALMCQVPRSHLPGLPSPGWTRRNRQLLAVYSYRILRKTAIWMS